MEDEAIKALKVHIWKFSVEKADMETYVSGACDLIIKQNNKIVAGIQVKPDSFYRMNITYVKELQAKLDYPVHDLIYDKQGDWKNFISVVSNFI